MKKALLLADKIGTKKKFILVRGKIVLSRRVALRVRKVPYGWAVID